MIISNFDLCVTLYRLCEHRCVSHLEAFSLTAVSAFSSALLRKKTEIFAEIWCRIMFRMHTNGSLLQRRRGTASAVDEESKNSTL